VAGASEELLDLVKHRVHIACPWQVVRAGEFDVFRAWDLRGHVSAMLHPDRPVVRAM
jgi:hypothetical protein